MDRRAEETLVCFRCGELFETVYCPVVDEGGLCQCESCGEFGLTTLQTVLDILNDLYLKGSMDEILANYIIYDDPDNIEELFYDGD